MAENKSTSTELFSALVKRFAAPIQVSRSSSSGRRSLSLRWYLVALIAGTLLPVLLFAVAIVYKLSSQDQVASERRVLLAARNLASTVERELSSTTRILQALASSERLAQGNLKSFHRETSRILQTQPTWITIILLSPDGQQLANTIQPFGKRLPQVREPESLQQVFETNQPVVGNLKPSITQPNLLGFPVRIPVMLNDKLQYVLTAVIDQKAIAKVVKESAPVDGEWTRTVVDGRGVVVARTRNPERFVGQRGTPSFLKRIGEATEGIYRDTTLEGNKVYVAFSRVDDSQWTVAVTVPVDVIQGPSRQAMWLVISSGLTLLLISGVGAFILARHISRSITSVAAAAEALAKDEYPKVSPLAITEVILLGEALERSANLLAQRERERTENLMKAEAARAEAEAANRIKDEFLAVLSHELRTPLNPILGWSKLLRLGKLDAAKTTLALETIERNAKLQTQLIEDLLDVSRIMQGKLSLNIAPVHLVDMIESAIETIRLAAEAKQIQIQTKLDRSTGQVLGDAARIQQVIWNLLSNAVKFTADGGRIEVQLKQTSLYAQLTISDTGKGIDPSFLPYVFEYFRQEDGKTTRKFGGLGLGLAIVRHLVELHGGTVQAHSLGEGQGATFIVRFPLQSYQTANDLESENYPGVPSSASSLAGLRVLLVDDDADTRIFVAFTLEQNQAIVTSVASAQEALQAFEQTEFDLLISDIGMPQVDGYMLMQQVRKMFSQPGNPATAHRYVEPIGIALTAYADKYNKEQALKAGFQCHLTKPVEPETLIKAIVSLINSRPS